MISCPSRPRAWCQMAPARLSDADRGTVTQHLTCAAANEEFAAALRSGGRSDGVTTGWAVTALFKTTSNDVSPASCGSWLSRRLFCSPSAPGSAAAMISRLHRVPTPEPPSRTTTIRHPRVAAGRSTIRRSTAASPRPTRSRDARLAHRRASVASQDASDRSGA